MARCPKFEYISGTGGFFSDCEYVCKISGKHFYASDYDQLKICDAEYGYKYEECPLYKKYS